MYLLYQLYSNPHKLQALNTSTTEPLRQIDGALRAGVEKGRPAWEKVSGFGL